MKSNAANAVNNPRLGMKYGMEVSVPNSTMKKMTVGDLIRELQAFPLDTVALISSDEEGNQFKHLYTVNGKLFGDYKYGSRYEGCGLKVGDQFVVIWPHG